MYKYFRYGANVHVNNIRLHYRRFNNPAIHNPKSLILVPGITSPAITWDFVSNYFGQYFDTYTIDVRGRGLSSSGPELAYDINTCADDIVQFIKYLQLDDYILIGHSMGGRHVPRAYVRGANSASRIILVDPPVSGPGRRDYPGQLPWYVDSIRASLRGMTKDEMRKYCPTWTDEQLLLRAEWLHTCYEPAVVQSLQEFATDDFHIDLPQLSCPTMLMCAGQGGVITPKDREEIASLLPQGTITVVEDSGHMIPWDSLPQFLEIIGSYLNVPMSISDK